MPVSDLSSKRFIGGNVYKRLKKRKPKKTRGALSNASLTLMRKRAKKGELKSCIIPSGIQALYMSDMS
jgi:hypothetical protein